MIAQGFLHKRCSLLAQEITRNKSLSQGKTFAVAHEICVSGEDPIACMHAWVVCRGQDVAIDTSPCFLLFVIFLANETFSMLPLLSERIDDGNDDGCIRTAEGDLFFPLKPACSPLNPLFQHHEFEVTFTT